MVETALGMDQTTMVNCAFFSGTEEQLEEGARNYWTIEAMAKFGGSFVKALAECARRADRQNLAKIKMTWPDYWKEYEQRGRELEKKHGN